MGATQTDTPFISITSGEALEPWRRVKLNSSNKAVYAGVGENHIGVTQNRVDAADLPVNVKTRFAPGTFKIECSGAVAIGADVFGTASGCIDDVAGGPCVGVARTAGSGAGSEIEIMPKSLVHEIPLVTAKTANYTVTVAENGQCFTTDGASGAVTFSLPPAVVGLNYMFRVGAAQELRIDPDGTEKVSLPSTGVPGAAGKYLTADANGETVRLYCTKAGEWSVFGHTGTWTAEA